ncbi:MAG: hypothetical protein ACW99G_15295 [Candidatus Thorarchaeota archaeon]
MSTESHTGYCKKRKSRYYEKKAAFIHKWGDHCRTCGGQGGKYGQYDPSGYGVMLSPGAMVEFHECPDCLDKNICPRCGENIVRRNDIDQTACLHCDWSEEDAESDYDGDYCLPPEFECSCYEEDEYEITREELEERQQLEIDLSSDPVVQARREDTDRSLIFLMGGDADGEEGD